MYISERSYHRYDALAQAVNSIDNQAAVALYRKYESLFQTVFNELSYPKIIKYWILLEQRSVKYYKHLL